MKKTIKLYSLALMLSISGNLMAATPTETNFLEVMKVLKVPYAKISTIKNIPEINADYIVLDLKDSKSKTPMQTAFLAFNKGKVIMPYDIEKSLPLVDKNGFALKSIVPMEKNRIENNMKLEKEKAENAQNDLIKSFNAKEDGAIVLNSGKSKTMVIFTDPHCPACNNDLNRIPEYMKNYNVNIVLTPLASFDKDGNVIKDPKYSLHMFSPIAASNIIDECSKASTGEDKLKILRKHFNTAQKLIKETPDKDGLTQVFKVNKKYLQSGMIDRTPTQIILP
jgi:thiol:disulfide interchange protein DsbC